MTERVQERINRTGQILVAVWEGFCFVAFAGWCYQTSIFFMSLRVYLPLLPSSFLTAKHQIVTSSSCFASHFLPSSSLLSSVIQLPLYPSALCPLSYPCAGSRWARSWMSGPCSMRRTRSCVSGSHRWRARSLRMATSALKRWSKSCERWFQLIYLTEIKCTYVELNGHNTSVQADV